MYEQRDESERSPGCGERVRVDTRVDGGVGKGNRGGDREGIILNVTVLVDSSWFRNDGKRRGLEGSNDRFEVSFSSGPDIALLEQFVSDDSGKFFRKLKHGLAIRRGLSVRDGW